MRRLPALALAATCVALIVTAAPRSGSLSSFPVTNAGRSGAPQPLASGVIHDRSKPTAPREPASSDVAKSALAARTVRGWATYYEDPRKDGPYAAAPWYRWGQDPEWVSVCAFDGGRSTCTNALVSDFCACGPRHGIPTVLDVAPEVFVQLAPLSRGIVRVQVFRGRPAPLAPSTDVVPVQ